MVGVAVEFVVVVIWDGRRVNEAAKLFGRDIHHPGTDLRRSASPREGATRVPREGSENLIVNVDFASASVWEDIDCSGPCSLDFQHQLRVYTRYGTVLYKARF